MIIDNYQTFLDQIIAKITEQGIDLSGLEMDHIGYQASSDEDYDNLVSRFKKIGTMVSEVTVGGRRVGIFKLKQPLKYKGYSIPAVELVAPKEGQDCLSALEHVEFVIDEDFKTFMGKYPELDWDTSAIDQKNFPLLKLRLDKHTQVKFHRENVLDIVEQEGL